MDAGMDPQIGPTGRYQFDAIRAGTVWIAESTRQSESVQNAFAAWARRKAINLKAKRQILPDNRVRISFIEMTDRDIKNRDMNAVARIEILDRQVSDLLEALHAIEAALSHKATSAVEVKAVENAKAIIAKVSEEGGAP